MIDEVEMHYTTEQVAEKLHVTTERVRRWLRSGRIHGVKLGVLGTQQEEWRVPASELRRLLAMPRRRSGRLTA